MSIKDWNYDGDENVGSLPVPGEDPRFDGTPDTGDNGGITVEDNGAFREIVDSDVFDPVDVDQDPFLPGVVDNDGVPGMRPFAEASATFEEEAGLEEPEDEEGDAHLSDEFHERLEQDAEASVDVQGRPVSDLDRMARVEHVRKAEVAKRAPYINIVPESAYAGLLGGRAMCSPGQDPVQVVNWVGEDVQAVPVTISIRPLTDTRAILPVLGNNYRGFARVTWGTRDGTQTAFIDVGTGAQFTVVASVVYVSVGLDPTATGSIELMASVGFYAGVRADAVTYTSYIDSIAQNETKTLYRPPFASHVWFYQPNIANSYVLSFLDQSANNAYVVRLNSAGTAPVYTADPIKLANDIVAVNVTNLGANTTIGRVVWGLYL